MDTSANSGTDRINLAALKRADPYILNILTSTAQAGYLWRKMVDLYMPLIEC